MRMRFGGIFRGFRGGCRDTTWTSCSRRMGSTWRRALVGLGTCVVILQAITNLVDWAPERNLLVLGYPDVLRRGITSMEVLAGGPGAGGAG